MATLVQVVGPSGSGKSTAIRTLDPETTFIINTDEKDLPFKSWKTSYTKEKGNYATVSKTTEVVDIFRMLYKDKNRKIKTVVIDTMNRLMTNKVMNERAISGFQKWADLSGSVYDIISLINSQMPDDMVVIICYHEDTFFTDDGIKVRRIGTEGQQLKRMNSLWLVMLTLDRKALLGVETGELMFTADKVLC